MCDTVVTGEETITVHDIIVMNARAGLDFQRENGSFPPGENYPYNEPVTPVRHTSAWARILAKAYDITGEAIFSDAANWAIDYLLGEEARPHGHTFHCRNIKNKSNGLIGQARAIQALTYCGGILNRQDALQIAKRVFSIHTFDDQLFLWKNRQIDGSENSFDRTLNHQITFAAIGTRIAEKVDIEEQNILDFLNNLENNTELYSDGIIKHYVRPPIRAVLKSAIESPIHYEMVVNEISHYYHNYFGLKERKIKEIGYHVINLLSLSLLHERYPENEFWQSSTLTQAFDFLKNAEKEIINGAGGKYGHPMPGIAIAQIRRRFENKEIKNLNYLLQPYLEMTKSADDKTGMKNPNRGTIQRRFTTSLLELPNFKIHRY